MEDKMSVGMSKVLITRTTFIGTLPINNKLTAPKDFISRTLSVLYLIFLIIKHK